MKRKRIGVGNMLEIAASLAPGLPASAWYTIRETRVPGLWPLIGAGAAALLAYYLAARQKRRDEKRKTCADAMAAALAWLEVPYRIRRRVSDDGELRQSIAGHIHELQERLVFFESWLLIELPAVSGTYAALVVAAKKAAADPAQEAWRAAPLVDAASMNIGSLGLTSVMAERDAFAKAVRDQFSWWRL